MASESKGPDTDIYIKKESKSKYDLVILAINLCAKEIYDRNMEEIKCNICLNMLNEKCIDCCVEVDADYRTCNVSDNKHIHQFHEHCIHKYFRGKSEIERKCPLCQEMWQD